MEDVKEPATKTVSYFDILTNFNTFGEDFSMFNENYSEVEEVTISAADGLTDHQLWAIVHCITKMKSVKKVEVSGHRIFLSNPYELLEEAGFDKEIYEETKGDSAKMHKARWMKKSATPKSTLPGTLLSTKLIISLNEMKEKLRQKLPNNE